MRVLVTGGAGYIGSHTCKALAAAGVEPIAFDNLVQGNSQAVQWGPLVVGDISDTVLLSRVMCQYDINAVMHFAGLASVGESVENPAAYYRNNLAGSLSLLDAMRNSSVQVIVFSSSCAVYGCQPSLPITEDALLTPISPYGRTKLMVEHVLGDEAAANGLRYVALRYFNAAGADPEDMIGDYRRNSTHLIPRALKAAAGQSEGVEIYGNDYSTPDGTCIRDYIHVADLALGHVLALNYLKAGGRGIAVNLGSGRGISVLNVLSSVERITGRTVPTLRRLRRPGDPPVLLADTATASRLLGFATKHSDINTIVETAWRFYEKNLH